MLIHFHKSLFSVQNLVETDKKQERSFVWTGKSRCCQTQNAHITKSQHHQENAIWPPVNW